jgi:signal transduction histidine kinase
VGEDGGRLLLGFDAVTPNGRIGGLGGEFGLLQMGLNAIATALEHRALEQERTRLEARLQQARRLETIGVFASGITHNLNNMLGAILGYAEMAGEQDADGRHYPNVLEQIRAAGQRARELVEQILTFARRRDPQLRMASLRSLVAESVSLLRASLPEAVELVVSNTADAVLLGEPAQLQQVILNLANNAAQAMSNTGLVELHTEVHSLAEARSLSHGVLAPGSYVCIVVSDHGRGIDPAMQERIFEPFFTTRWNGSGLGLATIREIVAEHKGAVHVVSTVGLGSRFEVWLPSAATTAPALDEELQATRIGRGETVLLVDHDLERLLRDEEILAALGFEPVGYRRAADAEAAFRAHPERFDLVVIGHLGATATALRLAATLRDTAPFVPLLLATPSADSIGANTLAGAGISDVVRWPIAAAEIGASLRDCLDRASRRPLAHRLSA